MELDKLKSAWDKVSSGNENKYSEEQLEMLLKRRTKDITGKVKRNIYIGLGIILAYVTISIIVNLHTSPLLDKLIGKDESEIVIFWGSIVDTILYILILGSLITFWVKFNKLQHHFKRDADLKQNINQQINLIKWYRKMFYLVLIVVLVVVIAGFTTGFILSLNQEVEQSGLNVKEAGFLIWAFVSLAFIISLSILLGIYYLLFNLFFKRLYGKHLIQLSETLNELQEPEGE
jgi:cell division protein FtsL